MSPVSLNVSLAVAGLTLLLGALIFVRLLLEFRALKELRSRPELAPLMIEIATLKSRLDGFKGRDWFEGKFVLRLLQKRLWDASRSPTYRARLLDKIQELNRLSLNAAQLAYELESLTDGQQTTL